MTRKAEFRLEGFDELERALAEDLPKATAKNVLLRVGKKGMKPVEDAAKRYAPKESGTLSQSITTKKAKAQRIPGSRRFARQNGVTIVTGPAPEGKLDKANAGWQERGTVNMAANPYMRPAADSELDNTLRSVKDDLKTEIEKAKQRIARKLAKQKAG